MRFSVIIPVHNREQRLHRQAIDSVLAQTFPDYELIVVDDGSSDDTAAVLASYGSRIRVFRQENQGAEIARHAGVRLAKGQYVVFLDSDDLLCRSALSTYDRVIRDCGSPPVVIGAWMYFAEGQAITEKVNADEAPDVQVSVYPDFLSRDLNMGLSNSLIVMHKALLQEIGARDPATSRLLLDDFHLCLRAGTRGPCVVVRKPVTVAYRLHGQNRHLDGVANVRAILSLVMSERGGVYPGGLERRQDRYRWIGSIGLYWIRRWVRAGRADLVLPLLLRASPMLLTAARHRITKRAGDSGREPVRTVGIRAAAVPAPAGEPI